MAICLFPEQTPIQYQAKYKDSLQSRVVKFMALLMQCNSTRLISLFDERNHEGGMSEEGILAELMPS